MNVAGVNARESRRERGREGLREREDWANVAGVNARGLRRERMREGERGGKD